MPTHAPNRDAPHSPPFLAAPTTPRAAPPPRWTELDPELRRALVRLLARLIGDHLPGPAARDGKGAADDRH
jgi:hypothetical protein